ncbi:hypothetical protein C8R45DRAFT_933012 [Mycena sanguinolenta]|nr:hypothetical protein C8R45DRAFT_933012 [Mycena sanguinolenta]
MPGSPHAHQLQTSCWVVPNCKECRGAECTLILISIGLEITPAPAGPPATKSAWLKKTQQAVPERKRMLAKFMLEMTCQYLGKYVQILLRAAMYRVDTMWEDIDLFWPSLTLSAAQVGYSRKEYSCLVFGNTDGDGEDGSGKARRCYMPPRDCELRDGPFPHERTPGATETRVPTSHHKGAARRGFRQHHWIVHCSWSRPRMPTDAGMRREEKITRLQYLSAEYQREFRKNWWSKHVLLNECNAHCLRSMRTMSSCTLHPTPKPALSSTHGLGFGHMQRGLVNGEELVPVGVAPCAGFRGAHNSSIEGHLAFPSSDLSSAAAAAGARRAGRR